MRALLLTALLVSVAAPAVAASDDGGRRNARQASEDRSDRSDNNASRSDRANRSDRAAARRADRPARAEPRQQVEREDPRVRGVQARSTRPVERAARDNGDSVRNWRSAERARDSRPDSVEQRARAIEALRGRTAERGDRQVERRTVRERQDYARSPVTRRHDGRISRVPIEGTQPPPPATASQRTRNRDHSNWRDRDGNHWRGDWRNDRRYDWRDYRNRHRSTFRIGVYFDPFGWNYRRYNVGWRLWPSYYSSRYWINDPWMYRLPYAPPGYRWIRYYDDAILIDTWTGQVEDVIYNFFW